MSRPWIGPLGLFLRGVVMGAADVVPGVSGGTVALITGIYQRLLDAIRAFRPRLWGVYRQAGIPGVWRSIDGAFLLALGLGIGTGVLALARLVIHLLATWPVAVWSLFFGLIAGSAVLLLLQIRPWNRAVAMTVVTGLCIAVGVALLRPGDLALTPWSAFFGGSLAICAMILPGVSGSFILLLLGLYTPVLGALARGDWPLLLPFALGCVCGLLAFSHLLGHLLERWRRPVMGLLTGFLAGSLLLVWPWKEGDVTSAWALLSPWAYAATEPGPALLLPGPLLMLAGALLVLLLGRQMLRAELPEPRYRPPETLE